MMSRIGRAWRILPPERRLAAIAAIGLFVSLFLPWYQETVIASSTTPALRSASASLTGWGAFSFVEAAVLLVAVGVLVLLFARAEGRAFHVPWGDGGVILAAGAWTCVLIIWRMFDKEGTTGHGQYATTSGIEWGIFVALGVAALLTYAGSRIRRAHEPEPPLPGERPAQPERTAEQSQAPQPRREPERRPRRPRTARTSSKLNFSDLDEIEFGEPPEVPTVRRAAPPQTPPSEPPPGPDDQLTIRLDD
ncbi:MAG: hypothetical protein ACLPV4_11275 [Solirubrobacteraceae bacterium]